MFELFIGGEFVMMVMERLIRDDVVLWFVVLVCRFMIRFG